MHCVHRKDAPLPQESAATGRGGGRELDLDLGGWDPSWLCHFFFGPQSPHLKGGEKLANYNILF